MHARAVPAPAATTAYIGDLAGARGAALPLLDESSHVGQPEEAVEIGATQQRSHASTGVEPDDRS